MHLVGLAKSRSGKILLIMILGMPMNGGWAQGSNPDIAEKGGQIHAPLAADVPNGAGALGENQYDGRQTESEIRIPPASIRPDEVNETRQKKRNLTGFWVIGILVNIVVMSAFVFWAVGQWRKTGR